MVEVEDVHGKEPLRERIGVVKIENGAYGERVCVTLEPSGWQISLNKTSIGNLLADLGEEDSDWVGQTVEVYAGEVETKNGPTDALLVRAADTKPKSAKSVSKPGKSDMDDEIPF